MLIHQIVFGTNRVNDPFDNLKVTDNVNIILESTERISQKNKNNSTNANTKYKKIKKKTVLVVGDSIANCIEESKLWKTHHIRVQAIPDGRIEDIQQNVKDLLHEDLETVIIHAGTNNATTDIPQMIVDKLITLKRNIKGSLRKYRIIIRKLIAITDNTKANTTIRNTIRLIKDLKIQTVDNSNISEKHLGKKRLHLYQEGNTVFVSSLLHVIRNFWNDINNDFVCNDNSLNINSNEKNFQQQTKVFTIDEIGKNIESDLTELSRLRNTYLKNPMIGYL